MGVTCIYVVASANTELFQEDAVTLPESGTIVDHLGIRYCVLDSSAVGSYPMDKPSLGSSVDTAARDVYRVRVRALGNREQQDSAARNLDG